MKFLEMKRLSILCLALLMVFVCASCNPSGQPSETDASDKESANNATDKNSSTIFDITDFGAVGDGETDCTEAIQKALDAAGEVKGTVIVPPGTYMTGELTMHPNTRLEGDAAWYFTEGDGNSVFVLNNPRARYMINITGAFGCTISGMSLSGNDMGYDVHGVYLYWPNYNGGAREDTPTIEDCRIGKFTGDGVHLEHIWCFSIRHSMIHSNRGTGLYIDGWDGFVLDNWFSHNNNYGVLGGPASSSITMTGNRVEWNKKGGFSFKSGDSVNITGNFFDRSYGPAIRLNAEGTLRDFTITGNVFRRNGCPDMHYYESEYENCSVYMNGVKNVTLVANTFKRGVNDDTYGTESPDYDVYLANSTAVIVQSNVMYDGALKKSIVYDGQGNNIIKDNLTNLPE